MNEQYDLFEILESEDSKERGTRAVREGYRKWLKAPELTPCGKRPVIDYCVHDAIIHRCETMPENVYMWENPVAISHGGEYWCRQTKGLLEGEQMDLCPYCRADLHAGEGQRYLVLQTLEKKKQIRNLRRQVKFELTPSASEAGLKAMHYIADFVYEQDGKTIVEDVKGYRKGAAWDLYNAKKKMLYYRYGIVIREV